ncbi:MAG TPA: decaprenyl-phosphate phosphoribosyltransferase [Armatimonadota bacterium]|nr:decaprenyl-phosphate phosphoribosyltransferase [Armatimonadota bacterium]
MAPDPPPDNGHTPDPTQSVSPSASLFEVILEAMRPRQWIKNLLLYAGVIFTANIFRPIPFGLATAAFVCFCLLSSAVYLFNDVEDRERDLAHPRKSRRPIASGRLPVSTAIAAAVILTVLGLAGGFLIRWQFGLLALGFGVLNVLYTKWLKDVVILDVLTIATGFIVRALAGAVAIPVRISPWLLVCTALLALVLGFGKRRQEITSLESAVEHRRVLEEYSPAFLDQLMASVTAATIVAYFLYSFQSETSTTHHWIPATIPFVLYGMFRYLYLVQKRNLGDAPEDLVFRDPPLLIAVLGWTLTAAVAMAVS